MEGLDYIQRNRKSMIGGVVFPCFSLYRWIGGSNFMLAKGEEGGKQQREQ